MATFGAVVSTLNSFVAEPSLPTLSFAVTLTVWLPSVRPAYVLRARAVGSRAAVERALTPRRVAGGTERHLGGGAGHFTGWIVDDGRSASVVNSTSTRSSRGVSAALAVVNVASVLQRPLRVRHGAAGAERRPGRAGEAGLGVGGEGLDR